jgi:RimJ/RimL family protein N-acetyltransferase
VDTTWRPGHTGTGPGPITPDGCAVELYERLPVGDEPDVIARAAPAGATVLELGCGVGRITHALLDRGFRVTAVDESPDMLSRVRGARTVLGAIEDLDLGEVFDVVLLGSFLVHHGDPAVRQALLRTCRRHLAPEGCVLVQRQGADRPELVPREAPLGDGTFRVVSCVPAGPGVRSVQVEYRFPDALWTQTFLHRPLTEPDLRWALAEAGLAFDTSVNDDGSWVRAAPATSAIATDRTLLVPLTVEDADEMADVLGDQALHAFTGGEPLNAGELRARYERLVAGPADGRETWCNWIVRARPDGVAVGCVQATVTDAGRRAEVAWVVGVPWQRQGYASEAAAALVSRLLDDGVITVIAHVHPDHAASQVVARRAGLHPTGEQQDGEQRWRVDART